MRPKYAAEVIALHGLQILPVRQIRRYSFDGIHPAEVKHGKSGNWLVIARETDKVAIMNSSRIHPFFSRGELCP